MPTPPDASTIATAGPQPATQPTPVPQPTRPQPQPTPWVGDVGLAAPLRSQEVAARSRAKRPEAASRQMGEIPRSERMYSLGCTAVWLGCLHVPAPDSLTCESPRVAAPPHPTAVPRGDAPRYTRPLHAIFGV